MIKNLPNPQSYNFKKSLILMLFFLVSKLALLAQSPSFSPSFINGGCAPYAISFINTTHLSLDTTKMTFQWNFSDGSTASTYDASHIYLLPGFYQASLFATDSMGNQVGFGYYSNGFQVRGSSGNFFTSAVSNSACPGEEIQFSNYDFPADSVSWDFGDGSPRVKNNAVNHIYTTPGTYQVKFYFYSSTCSYDTIEKTIQISNNVFPVIQAQGSSNSSCPNESINFYNNFYNSSYSYVWDFNDGDTSHQISPSHSFVNIGSYSVTLTATNSCGNSTIDTVVIDINTNTPANASFNINAPNPSCPYENIMFFPMGGSGDFFWDFGDGDTSMRQMPNHLYADTGSYTVRLIVMNNCGNADTTYQTMNIQYNTSFTPNSQIDFDQQFGLDTLVVCPGEPVSIVNNTFSSSFLTYKWLFGDGDSATSRNVVHSYFTPGTYTVSMAAKNGCGGTDTAYKWVRVSNTTPVSANLQSLPGEICPGENVYFFDENFDERNGYTYSVWFGNGDSLVNITNRDTGIGVLAYERYDNPGVYNYTFVVTNLCGNSETLNGVVTVTTSSSSQPFFLAGNDADDMGSAVCPGTEIPFFAVGGIDYMWYFGDGTTDTNAVTVHTYTASGVYNASVVITNACGVTDTVETTAYSDGNFTPNAFFNMSDNFACGNDTIFFTYGGGGNQSNQYTFNWSFGDGDSAYTRDAWHVYTESGNYQVRLSVTNACGTSTNFQQINITLPNVQLFGLASSGYCEQANAVSLTGSPAGGSFWVNGVIGSSSFNPNTVGVGQHTVTYSYTDGIGCTGYDEQVVNVNALPDAGLPDSIFVCMNNGSISLVAAGGAQYVWSNGETTSTILVAAPNATAVYSVTLTDANGCINADTVGISMVGLPTLTVTASDTLICIGESCTITAIGGFQYLWSNGATTSSIDVSPTDTTWFSVTVADVNGCVASDSLQILVDDCVGIKENSNENLVVVYPNPATNQVTIEYVGNLLQLKIIDVNGRVVFAQNILTANYKQQINTETFAKGVYTIQLVTKTGTVNKRLVIN